jgi:Pin2-interacting protein X1
MTSSINADLLVGKKLRREHQQSFREHVSAPTSEFAKRQLEKMGWSEGTGLGKKRDGVTSHIQVKRRKDNLGLGGSDKPAVVEALGDSEWWKDSLGATLAKLGTKKEKKKRKRDKTTSTSTSTSTVKTFTDEELFQATGGARFGMRAGITSNLHKWVRTENGKEGTAAATASAKSDSNDGSTIDKDMSGKQDSTQDATCSSSDKEGTLSKKKPKKDGQKTRKRDKVEVTSTCTDIPEDVNVDKAFKREERKAKKARKEMKKNKKTKA